MKDEPAAVWTLKGCQWEDNGGRKGTAWAGGTGGNGEKGAVPRKVVETGQRDFADEVDVE